MKVAPNTVVTLDYTLKNSDGILIDSSKGQDPLVYLHGVGNLIPGLEKELSGMGKGEQLKTVIPPEEAYGNRRDDLYKVVSKEGFQGDDQVKVGMQVQLETEYGPAYATIDSIEGDDVTLDMNHPLADMTLHFDVNIVDVRKATKEEISHGHAHSSEKHA